MRLGTTLTALAILGGIACKPQDPKDPEPWMARLTDVDAIVRVKAARELRRLKARPAAPALAKALGDPAVREDAALALGELGGAESVQPLIDAIDTSIGAGSDAATRAGNRANTKIAEALGLLGDAKAGPALLRLSRAQDGAVRAAAISALGQLRFREAVTELSHIVDADASPPSLLKKAVMALGQIGDPAGIPALQRALVIEKQGVSFLPEASYALFQLGAPAVEPMLKLLTDGDAAYLAWARERSRAPAGIYAKSAIVLGDLGDLRAVPALLGKLGYSDADPNPLTARLLTSKVREFAADSLGRLRARDATKPILALVKTADPMDEELTAFATNALVWIGDRSLAPKLLERAAQPGTFASRLLCAQAAVLLGDPSLLGQLKSAAAAKDKKPFSGNCAGELQALTGADLEESAACGKLAGERVKAFAALEAPLLAAGQCAQATACWAGKLADAQALVRARAAYELGRAGATGQVAALSKAAADSDLHARIAAIRALEWLLPLAPAQGALKTAAVGLGAQLQAEQGSLRYVKVNEELRRLQAKLLRL